MGILTNKPSGGGVIITRAEVDESGFCIVILPEIADGFSLVPVLLELPNAS